MDNSAIYWNPWLVQERCGVPPWPCWATSVGGALRCMRRAENGAAGGAMLLAGRYKKLKRGLSQSPWLIGGEAKVNQETGLPAAFRFLLRGT